MNDGASRLTASEWASLEAYALQGDQRAAAIVRGVSYQTLRNQLQDCYRKLGVSNGVEAFRALGWLVPR